METSVFTLWASRFQRKQITKFIKDYCELTGITFIIKESKGFFASYYVIKLHGSRENVQNLYGTLQMMKVWHD